MHRVQLSLARGARRAGTGHWSATAVDWHWTALMHSGASLQLALGIGVPAIVKDRKLSKFSLDLNLFLNRDLDPCKNDSKLA